MLFKMLLSSSRRLFTLLIIWLLVLEMIVSSSLILLTRSYEQGPTANNSRNLDAASRNSLDSTEDTGHNRYPSFKAGLSLNLDTGGLRLFPRGNRRSRRKKIESHWLRPKQNYNLRDQVRWPEGPSKIKGPESIKVQKEKDEDADDAIGDTNRPSWDAVEDSRSKFPKRYEIDRYTGVEDDEEEEDEEDKRDKEDGEDEENEEDEEDDDNEEDERSSRGKQGYKEADSEDGGKGGDVEQKEDGSGGEETPSENSKTTVSTSMGRKSKLKKDDWSIVSKREKRQERGKKVHSGLNNQPNTKNNTASGDGIWKWPFSSDENSHGAIEPVETFNRTETHHESFLDYDYYWDRKDEYKKKKKKFHPLQGLPSDCGQAPINSFKNRIPTKVLARHHSTKTRLMNGDVSEWGEWPWQAVLRIGGILCGGAIIGERMILMAPQCFFNKNINFETIHQMELVIDTGKLNLRPRDAQDKMMPNKVEMMCHNDRAARNAVALYDYAVITTVNKIPFNKYVQPICLANHDMKLPYDPTDNPCYATEWCKMDREQNNTHPDKLHKVRVFATGCPKGLDHESCKCYESPKQNSSPCQVHSGGPVACWDKRYGAWFLEGLTSFGPKNCSSEKSIKPSSVAVYKSVASMLNNIHDCVKKLNRIHDGQDS